MDLGALGNESFTNEHWAAIKNPFLRNSYRNHLIQLQAERLDSGLIWELLEGHWILVPMPIEIEKNECRVIKMFLIKFKEGL